MKSLILDSATKKLYVCLVIDGKVCYEKYIEGKNDHAKAVVFSVDEALKTNNIVVDNLDEVIVGYGPGSYTGVRMAVTVAKMIASFKHITLYTISTLKLMASDATKKGRVLAMIDARRGNSFSAIISGNDYLVEEGMYNTEEMLNKCFDVKVIENDFVVDPFYVLNNKKIVNEPDLLVPNYLRDTEAERNFK